MSDRIEAVVAIIDYGLANMFSVERACAHVGLTPVITADAAVIESAAAVILPGVGAFGEAMSNLRRLDLITPIQEFAASGKPFAGVCLGMQLLFTESEEFGASPGLNIIEGQVVRLPGERAGNKVRVPQVGWNQIRPPVENGWDGTPLSMTAPGEYMYFLHSYCVAPSDAAATLSVTTYEGVEFASAVARENVFGFQFHPEKSAQRGIDIYKAFAKMLTLPEVRS